MKRFLAAMLVLCTTVAHAGPHQVLVLRAEGTADVASRTSVDTHVLRLAKHIDGKIEAGDITLSDAAAAAGCDATSAACKDEILMTFGVDEVVTSTVTSSGGQLTVTVRRLTKGNAPKVAASTIPSGKAPEGKLDADLGPLFGLAPAPASNKSPVKEPDPTPTPATATTSSTTLPTEPAPVTTPDTNPAPINETPAQPAATTPEGAPPNRKLQKIGIGVSAGLVLLSVVMWSSAAGKQDEIDAAPADTPADFVRLQELERDADGHAGLGNLFFVGGIVLGGISGYYFWKKGRQARAQTARITPTVFPHGAGLVLTFGGAR